MDVAFSLAGVIEQFKLNLSAGDYEGAEEILLQALPRAGLFEPYLHLELGRLYMSWNKLTSAGNHLNKAAELAHGSGDEPMRIQILEELNAVRRLRAGQAP